MLGEPLLRWRAGRRAQDGPVSVPLLITPVGTQLGDSWDIALWADAHGGGDAAPLIPDNLRDEIRGWHDRAERLSAAGRALSIRRTPRSSPWARRRGGPGRRRKRWTIR
jgi:glutathione S-transferase